MDSLPFLLAHHVGLAPVLWLCVRSLRGAEVRGSWWVLAGAFFVSWVTDALAHSIDPSVLSLAYPVAQASLIAMVFLPYREATAVTLFLLVVGVIAALYGAGPDVLLRTAAFGVVTVIAWPLAAGPLRSSLLVYFAGGLLCWYAYALWPGWTSWTFYQLTRLAGIVLFCVAASRSPKVA